MSLFKITRADLENFTVVATPKRTFVSSSTGGVTGSLQLFAQRSPAEKETQPLSLFDASGFIEGGGWNYAFSNSGSSAPTIPDVNTILKLAADSGRNNGNNNRHMQQYLSGVNNLGESARKFQTLNMDRFEPSFTLTNNSVSKNQIVDSLMSYYRSVYPQAHFGYTNYHTLNFFTSSELPETSAIIYPNTSSLGSSPSSPAAPYTLNGGFTFDFWINPRYTTDDSVSGFKAGTIYHLSSSYAVSLISGSSVDGQGRPDAFRLLLQLSHSADVSPSLAAEITGSRYPTDLIFSSSNNILKRNHWHHVAIRWGTNTTNKGSGSFFVDGVEEGSFVVPSSSIANSGGGNPDVLIIGNYYEGNDTGDEAQQVFFAEDPASRDGLIQLSGLTGIDEPTPLTMNHPLNAEVHDLKIYDRFRLTSQIESNMASGSVVGEAGLVFYVPPFFTKESPFRKNVGTFGGVLQTPFFAIDATTDDPFNVAMSFGVGGHYLNNENFGRDFVTGNYPRWFHLTMSQIQGDAQEALSANSHMFDLAPHSGSVRKRNVSLLPCDNGLFTPNFKWLLTGSNQTQPQRPASGSLLSKYVNDLGTLDLSTIQLKDLIPTSSLRKSLTSESGSLFNKIVGATPDNPGVDPGEVLTIFQRTRDNSSNEISMFDMSNMFYGERINPGSFVLTDSAITGTQGKVSITLKDNGVGSLYRADALTKNATWNSVGNIFYNEGILMVKSPNIPLFGEEQWESAFEGEHCIHTLKLDVVAGAGMVDSSSNPTYIEVSASFEANDKDPKFVYITNILYLDDNLNVIMKSNLSQPVVMRRGEKITFRPRIDY